MVSLNGIVARLVALEELSPPPPPPPEDDAESRQWWWDNAPDPVRQYLVAVLGDVLGGAQERHPYAQNVIDAVYDAIEAGADSVLAHVQGVVLARAMHTLSWALAYQESAGKAAATTWTYALAAVSAERLLGGLGHAIDWRQRLQPERLADLWHQAPMPDQQTLDMAKLGSAELALLAATDDRRHPR